MKQDNEKFCSNCGAVIDIKAEICPKCGVRQAPAPGNSNGAVSFGENRWLISLLLCWFLGFLGIHRFYNGHMVIGVLQLLTAGGCGIWVIIDFILLITGNFKDAQGNILRSA